MVGGGFSPPSLWALSSSPSPPLSTRCLCYPPLSPVFSRMPPATSFSLLFFLFFLLLLLPPSILKEERRCNFHAMARIFYQTTSSRKIIPKTVFAMFASLPNVGDTILLARFKILGNDFGNLLESWWLDSIQSTKLSLRNDKVRNWSKFNCTENTFPQN